MDNRILVAATGVNEMKPSPEQVREWVAQIKSESGEGYTQELCELAAAWGASQAQQTTEPLGFQIRRAIAAEDELRATKQTLEHAYAALQKVADAQAAIEEPELPEAALSRRKDPNYFDQRVYEDGPKDPMFWESYYTAAQMHDHFHAGVRAGMAQSQDAKLEPLVREALRKAFSFGQRYWQQADSEYASDHKKSDKTQLKFLALIEETIAAMQGEQQ